MQEFWHNFWIHRSKDGLIDNFLILLVGIGLGWIGRGVGWVGRKAKSLYQKDVEYFASLPPEVRAEMLYLGKQQRHNSNIRFYVLLTYLLLCVIMTAVMHDDRRTFNQIIGWVALLFFSYAATLALYNPFLNKSPHSYATEVKYWVAIYAVTCAIVAATLHSHR